MGSLDKELLKIFKQLPPPAITEIMLIVEELERNQLDIDHKKEKFLEILAEAIDLKQSKDKELTSHQRGIIE